MDDNTAVICSLLGQYIKIKSLEYFNKLLIINIPFTFKYI